MLTGRDNSGFFVSTIGDDGASGEDDGEDDVEGVEGVEDTDTAGDDGEGGGALTESGEAGAAKGDVVVAMVAVVGAGAATINEEGGDGSAATSSFAFASRNASLINFLLGFTPPSAATDGVATDLSILIENRNLLTMGFSFSKFFIYERRAKCIVIAP